VKEGKRKIGMNEPQREHRNKVNSLTFFLIQAFAYERVLNEREKKKAKIYLTGKNEREKIVGFKIN
jgi:hypothetical protein